MTTGAIRRAGLAALAVAILVCSAPAAAGAAVFTVTRFDDPVPGDCGAVDCSLRSAVDATNAAAGADVIVLRAGTYALTREDGQELGNNENDLNITGPLTIRGAGAGATVINAIAMDAHGTASRVLTASTPVAGVVALTGVTLTGARGSAIRQADSAAVQITDSAVTANSGSQAGGIDTTTGAGSLTVTRSTISGNMTNIAGGGIQAEVPVTVVNSTISGNTAQSLTGGGGIQRTANGTVTVLNSTITGNTAPVNRGGGIAGPATLKNTIIAANNGGNCSAPLTSQGHNIESATDCQLDGAGDQQGVNPQLGPLAANGGPTRTHALAAGTPAVNAGDNSGCPATDQRGRARPDGPACDIGAYEIDLTAPDTAIVSGPGTTTDTTPTFAFFSNEPGTAFQCRVAPAPFSSCGSPHTTGAVAAGAHTFEVRAFDLGGNADASPASRAFTVELPAPVLGRQFNLEPAGGTVYVSLPRGKSSGVRAAAYRSPIKGRRFVPLAEARQIPMGSFVDTRSGTVRLTSARDSRGRKQTARFGSGVFQVLQSRKRSQKGLTELRMKGGSFKNCGTSGRRKGRTSALAHDARRSKRRIRRLRGNGRGRFRTRGRYSAATVRGTVWTVEDRCDGTLTSVRRGRVDVRDLRRKKTIKLKRGKRYLARAA